ncbi:hypothetical protein Pcinc_013215 [Petrolisthes cinctipes]|uniref:L1 transposable element RRM domain-containing protein n=1 Tax=Petrolisthes cinctipes TaxID=88211 RepID=A0AAE1KSH5_PETCI|nr:hypothetical protein Pcinc_013215 [Petrolisthes cinctipes]
MDLEDVKVLLEAQDKTFKTALDIIVEQLKSRIQHSEETITDLVKSLEFTQAEVKELQNEVPVLKTSNNDNKTTIEIMKSQIEELERRTNYQEDYNRRNNLRFTGIQEQPGGESWEETAQIVTKLLEDKLQVPTMKLERAHRIGQANPSRQRTIVARFEKFGDRETVLRNARKLKGSGIYINEDLCQASQEIRNKQLPLLKEARNLRLPVTSRRGGLVVTSQCPGVLVGGGRLAVVLELKGAETFLQLLLWALVSGLLLVLRLCLLLLLGWMQWPCLLLVLGQVLQLHPFVAVLMGPQPMSGLLVTFEWVAVLCSDNQ